MYVVSSVSKIFVVDVTNAGQGDLEIAIGCDGHNIENEARQVAPGIFEINYTPISGGAHQASVKFNKQHVTGNHVTLVYHVAGNYVTLTFYVAGNRVTLIIPLEKEG